MSIGMSYDEFWEGDAALPKFYREAYRLKRERETEQANFNAWLQGFYNAKAYAVVLENAFADKNSEPSRYFDKPVPLEKKNAEEQQEDVEAARLRMRIALDNFVDFYKKKK